MKSKMVTVSRGNIAKYCRVSVKTVSSWYSRGMPKKNAESACIWLHSNGFAKRAARLRIAAGLVSIPDKAQADKPITGAKDNRDVAAMVERVRDVEQAAFARFNAAKGTEIEADAGNEYLAASEQRRKIEKDSAGIQKDQGDVVLRSEVRSTWLRLAQETRSAVLAMPDAIAPRLVGLDAPHKAHKIVDQACRDLLRGLTDKAGACE